MSIGTMYSVSEFAEFAEWLQRRRERSERKVGIARGGVTASAPPEVSLALAESFRDLDAAVEELRAQNEALFAARTEVEGEAAWLRELFELAPVAYVVTDVDGRLLRANQAARALLRRPANALVGKPLVCMVASAERPAFLAAMLRAIEVNGVATWPVRLLPRGARKPIECRVRIRVSPTIANLPAPPLYWTITDESDDELL